MVAEISSDAVIGFAKQGHPQAIAVLLNRALVPNGAHVKVRQKNELLKILINFLRETNLDVLVSRVQETLNEISPQNVERVQIFTQRLGDRQASFRKEICTTSSGSSAPVKTAEAIEFEPMQPPIREKVNPSTPNVSVPAPAPSNPLDHDQQNRYSVAEYLSQVSDIEDLAVLEDHPFFTAVCPKCRHGYSNLKHPPLFWDCPACGWRDDLSQKVPRHKLRETPQRHRISQGKRLGSYLIEAGLLTPAQIEVALADQQLNGVRLGEVLVRRGWIKEETVEYFMRKVVEPERQASENQAEAYLESSRNLVKTLMQQNKETQKSVTEESPAPEEIPASSSDLPSPAPTSQPRSPINEKETLILSDVDAASLRPPHNPNAVNERETLLLPDMDIAEMIEREAE